MVIFHEYVSLAEGIFVKINWGSHIEFDRGPCLLFQGDLKKPKMALVAQGTGRAPAILVVH